MFVRILFLVLAISAAIAHGYRFRHYKKKILRDMDGLSQDFKFKGGGFENNDERKVIRQKRVSDQRLAELETLIALSEMKGNYIKTPPNAFRIVDPRKAGRKRRSSSTPVILDRILESLAREREEEEGEGESATPERSLIQWPPYFWSDQKQSE